MTMLPKFSGAYVDIPLCRSYQGEPGKLSVYRYQALMIDFCSAYPGVYSAVYEKDGVVYAGISDPRDRYGSTITEALIDIPHRYLQGDQKHIREFLPETTSQTVFELEPRHNRLDVLRAAAYTRERLDRLA